MFRGKFKSKTDRGTNVLYNINDVVLEQGSLYKCVNPSSVSPVKDKNKWVSIGLSEVYKGTLPPVSPIENQMWISNSGVMYIWYRDDNGFQWIEV